MNALLFSVILAGQCGPNGCAVPTIQPAPMRENVYEWRATGDANQLALYRDGVQIGNYYKAEKQYVRLDGVHWIPREQGPPVPPPASAESVGEVKAAYPNYGLDLDKISRDKSYSVNGKLASRDDALDAVAGKLTDDSGKMFLTIIGSKEDCAAVQRDLDTAPALKGVRDRVHLHCYQPSDPMVAKSGFVVTGKPTIYMQAPGESGKVLHRQDEYRGPDALAEAIRKADPNYKPANDPDANSPLASVKNLPPMLWVILGLGGLVYISKQKQVTK
jgi:hypothetical protein